MPTYYISDLNRWAESEGGKCTSKEYHGLNVPHNWLCSKGHSFELKPTFVRQGAWCPKCSQVIKSEEALSLMRKFAEKHEGKCLSQNYVNNDTILEWKCKNNHTFKDSRSVITCRKNFCKQCAEEDRNKKNFNNVKKIAEKKGGKCLSKKYVSRSAKMKFQCAEGHIWETSYQSIYFDKSWCVRCMPNRRITMAEVNKWSEERDWVCLSKTVKGKYDRLLWKCNNGHTVDMMLVLFQRGQGCNKCNSDSSKKKALKLMQKWAKERGGKYLSNEYIDNEQHLIWECKNGHQFLSSRDYIKQKDGETWCNQCNQHKKRQGKLQEMIDYAKKKGGKCLSTEYVNLDTPLTFKCKKGHVWETPPFNIVYSKTWCPKCVANAKLDIETMREMAAARNGKCLSKKYINTTTKLKWKCEKGHIWESNPYNIRAGHWCPKCWYKKRS